MVYYGNTIAYYGYAIVYYGYIEVYYGYIILLYNCGNSVVEPAPRLSTAWLWHRHLAAIFRFTAQVLGLGNEIYRTHLSSVFWWLG